MKRGAQQGVVALVVVMLTASLLLLLGLVVDGGRILAARARVGDEAQEAARAGAQELSAAVAHGAPGSAVEQARATAAAQRYLAATGDAGQVTVTGDQVVVTVTGSLTTQILGLIGVSSVTVSQTQAARAERGVATVGATR